MEMGRTEETCIQLDALEQEDHPYAATREERIRYQGLLVSHSEQHWQKRRQELANVKTFRKKSQIFVRRKVQPFTAVRSSVFTCHRLSVFHRDLNRNRSSSANNLNMHIHKAWGDLERMSKQMSLGTAGGHRRLPSGGTGGRTGTGLTC